jgi:hypothetical protein
MKASLYSASDASADGGTECGGNGWTDGRLLDMRMTDGGGRMYELTHRRMLEAAIRNGAKELWLEKEIAETRCVYSSIAAFLVPTRSNIIAIFCTIVSSSSCIGSCSGVVRLQILVGIVDEVFLVRHVDCWMREVV